MMNLTEDERARIECRLQIEKLNWPGYTGNYMYNGTPYYLNLTRAGTIACP